MKKILTMAVVFLACLELASCGGTSKTEQHAADEAKLTVVPETAVRGPLGEYFTVVDRTYTLKKDGMGHKLTIEVERNDKTAPFGDDICYFSQDDEMLSSKVGGFGYEILDEDGEIIAKKTPDGAAYSWDEMLMALRTLPGQTNSFSFMIYDLDGTPAKVRITSDVRDNTATKGSAQLNESLNDVEEDVNNMNDKASDALKDVDKAVEVGKAAVETSKAAIDMLNTLNKLK